MTYKDAAKQREYQRLWLKSRRDAWIQEHGPCAVCGSSADLQVDHVDRQEKSIDVGRVWSLSQEKREAELSKCQVLCKTCHAEKSLSEGFVTTIRHGRKRYSAGCRCPVCRAANAAEKKRWRMAVQALSNRRTDS